MSDREAPFLPICAGQRYRLRNGATVSIVGVETFGAPDDCAARGRYTVWVGRCLETGERCSWGMDGRYSPLYGVTNELDIVATA